MKYNIISINDERKIWKDHIRRVVKTCDEVFIPSVIGTQDTIPADLNSRGLKVCPGLSFSVGEIGIWLSVFDCWEYAVTGEEELIVFEDDASPADDFDEKFKLAYHELPADYDLLSLWPPTNQHFDYLYNCRFDEEGLPQRIGYDLSPETSLFNFGAERLARVYQGYGNVATLVSPAGAAKMLSLARQHMIYSPIDCWMWQNCHNGRLTGYSPKPQYADLVWYHWPPTQVHSTERYII